MPLTTEQTRIITQSLPGISPPALSCASVPASNSTLSSGEVGTGNTATGSAIEGTRVYSLCGNASRLLIYDVSNPAAMVKVGDQTLNSGAFAVNQPVASAIGVKNSLAYVANYPTVGACSLAVYDCTNPGAVTQPGTFLLGGAGTSNGGPRRVGVSIVGADTFVFVAFNDIINILKVTNPAAIVSVATVTVPDVAGNFAQGVFVFNNVLYGCTQGLNTGDYRGKAWNVAVPSAPALLWDSAITDPNSFTLTDIYAVNQNGSPIAAVLIQELPGHGALQVFNGTTGALLGTLIFSVSAIQGDGQLWIDPTGACCEVTFSTAATLRLVNLGNPASPADISGLGLTGQYNSVVGLSSGTPHNVFVTGTVGGGNFSLRIESVNV